MTLVHTRLMTHETQAYLGPDGEPRLFRPDKNMERMEMSSARVALPPFDTNELLKLIKKLVALDARWIPTVKGHSLYIRPTIIGTRDCTHPISFALSYPT